MEELMESQPTLKGVLAVSAGGPDKRETITLDVSNLPTMAELERQYLNLVLARENGSKSRAAKILGLSVKTMYNKLGSYRADETAEVIRPGT
jgi:DNA-binding NtrC family response regulator